MIRRFKENCYAMDPVVLISYYHHTTYDLPVGHILI